MQLINDRVDARTSLPFLYTTTMGHVICDDGRKELWLVGIGTNHSVAPALHTFIAAELGLPWVYRAKDFADEDECVQQIRTSICAGCAVTMPWKSTIMPLLDDIDISARSLGACNTISIDANHRLIGANHDWVGIAGALRELGVEESGTPTSRSGLVIGAGGAARAAVYALWKDLGVDQIYIINRYEREVLELQRDLDHLVEGIAGSREPLRLEYVATQTEAAALISPTYIVGTVPDFEPESQEELNVKALLAQILKQSAHKGVLVDMCYKPRYTRHISMAERAGWKTVQGWRVVGHQAKQQWISWAGNDTKDRLNVIESRFWTVLREAADNNVLVNPAV